MAFAPRRDFVVGAVKVDKGVVYADLLQAVHAFSGLGNLVVDIGNSLGDALAAIAFLSPSRISRASRLPVDAPEGTAARAEMPLSSVTSTSTVGLPRESRISRHRRKQLCSWLVTPCSFIDVFSYAARRALARRTG